MYKKAFGNLRLPLKLCAATVCSTIVYNNIAYSNESVTSHVASGFNYCRKFYPASSEYPELAKHRNIMARNLTKDTYAKLRDLRTRNGFNIDDAIQTGLISFTSKYNDAEKSIS